MMRTILPVFRRSLHESWRGLVGWSLGITAVLALYLPLYPSMAANGQLEAILETLPKQLVDTLGYDQMTSGAGYTEATFYSLMGFLLLTIAAILWGSAAIAGAEESGRLELDLAHGISRTTYALEQAAAIFVKLAWLGTYSTAVIWVMNGPAELHLSLPHLVGAAVGITGLSLLHAMAALFAGALTGRRAWATGVAAGIAVLGYAFQALSKQNTDLEWLRWLSPYAWVLHGSPLVNGINGGLVTLTWAIAVVFAVAATLSLRWRDLRG